MLNVECSMLNEEADTVCAVASIQHSTLNIQHSTFNIQHSFFPPPTRHQPTCRRSREGLCIRDSSACSCCCTDRSNPSTCGSFFGCCAPPGCGVGCGFCCDPRSCCDPLPPPCCFCMACFRRRAISRLRFAAASEGRIRNAS